MEPQEDNRYGYEESPGNFTGIIGSLQQGKAHLAVADLTVTSGRHKGVAFTYPILRAGHKILYKVPDSSSIGEGFTVLLAPFTAGLWVLIFLMFIAVSVIFYVIGRFSPYEDHAFVGKAATYEGLTFINSFLYVFSSLTFQGRVMAAIWWMFTMLVIAAYTASLAAIFLAIKPSVRSLPFATFDELSKQSKVAYGIVGGGSTEYYLKTSTQPVQKRLWGTINAHDKNLMVDSVNAGIMRVAQSDGDFALIMEGPLAEYFASQPPCNLMALGEPLSEHAYAFACNDTQLCHKLNQYILSMIEDDFIYQTKEKWLHGGCRTDDTAEYIFQGLAFFDTFGGTPEYYASRSVTLRRFGVAFLLLLIGIVASAIVLVAEIFYAKRRGTAVPQRLPRMGGEDQQRIDREFRDEDA
nr:hypothetical protein BaRGS_027287 [Batillaria attramentaria]